MAFVFVDPSPVTSLDSRNYTLGSLFFVPGPRLERIPLSFTFAVVGVDYVFVENGRALSAGPVTVRYGWVFQDKGIVIEAFLIHGQRGRNCKVRDEETEGGMLGPSGAAA